MSSVTISALLKPVKDHQLVVVNVNAIVLYSLAVTIIRNIYEIFVKPADFLLVYSLFWKAMDGKPVCDFTNQKVSFVR